LGIYVTGSRALIANNSIGGAIHSNGISASSSDSLIILNNVIYQNMTGISLSNNGTAVIKNNIICHHSGDRGKGIWCTGDWAADVSYNDFWDNTADCEGFSPGVGILYENPLFVNPEAGDFHLQPTSPCIDAGDPAPQYRDLDGSRNDMGVYGGPYALPEGSLFRPPVGMTLGDTSAAPGDMVEVAVRLEKAAGVAEASMVISYPSDTLAVLDVRTTDYSRRFSLTTEDMGPGQMRISLSSSNGIEEESYPFVCLMVKVHRFVSEGGKGRIRVSEASLRDDLAMPLTIGQISEGTVEVKTEVVRKETSYGIPSRFTIFQNYPNPFNFSTTIHYQLPVRSHVTLKVYNLLGQEVRTLVDKQQSPGHYAIQWDGKDIAGRIVASGIYFCKIKAAGKGKNFVKTIKMLILR